MSDEEWGPWVEHDGKGCPVSKGVIVKVELVGSTNNGWRFNDSDTVVLHQEPSRAITITKVKSQGFWDWSNFGNIAPLRTRYSKAIRYQVKKPKGLKMLEELIQNLPAPTKEMEKT